MSSYAIKALGFRSKTRSSPWFLPASLSCKLPSGLTKTCSSLEDGVARIRSLPCLLYGAVHHVNIKVLDQQWSPLFCLVPQSAQKDDSSKGQNRTASETPLLSNTWDKGRVSFQPRWKLIPGSCSSKEKGFHWILAITDVHKLTGDKLQACKTLQHSSRNRGDLPSNVIKRNLSESSHCPTAAGEARFPPPSSGSMQFPGRDLNKVHCFKELRGEEGKGLCLAQTKGSPSG